MHIFKAQFSSRRPFLGALQWLRPPKLRHDLVQSVPRCVCLALSDTTGARKPQGKVSQQALKGKGVAIPLLSRSLAAHNALYTIKKRPA